LGNLIFDEKKKREGIKKGIRMSHRYDYLPLLCSQPGGVQQELVASLCRAQRYGRIFESKYC